MTRYLWQRPAWDDGGAEDEAGHVVIWGGDRRCAQSQRRWRNGWMRVGWCDGRQCSSEDVDCGRQLCKKITGV
eukprot:scaffold14722_cov65-Cyclotella_meneghiniana.AAC.1